MKDIKLQQFVFLFRQCETGIAFLTVERFVSSMNMCVCMSGTQDFYVVKNLYCILQG
jgi:hypothetical protein